MFSYQFCFILNHSFAWRVRTLRTLFRAAKLQKISDMCKFLSKKLQKNALTLAYMKKKQ